MFTEFVGVLLLVVLLGLLGVYRFVGLISGLLTGGWLYCCVLQLRCDYLVLFGVFSCLLPSYVGWLMTVRMFRGVCRLVCRVLGFYC